MKTRTSQPISGIAQNLDDYNERQMMYNNAVCDDVMQLSSS